MHLSTERRAELLAEERERGVDRVGVQVRQRVMDQAHLIEERRIGVRTAANHTPRCGSSSSRH